MALGKPDAGKPPVRFDEGRSATVIGLVPLQPVRSAYSTSDFTPPILLKTAENQGLASQSELNRRLKMGAGTKGVRRDRQ